MAFALHFIAIPCKSRNPFLSTHSSSSTQSNWPLSGPSVSQRVLLMMSSSETKKRRRRKRKRKRTGKRKGRWETKKKKNVKVIRLVSSAGTGFSHAKKRNMKSKEVLEIQKYNPNIRSHVKFTEVSEYKLKRYYAYYSSL